ncbi:hypothetical protein DPMN_178389 [Dreissena polymorpha]|uniref:Uncharacterized protein n=1 Tax=Dreissena polymorpha TaxID=45954 RepID=A0A9D4EEY3_DREPO|nr:hypothetical protein DPMN_178389 [Dreissena polymorpha]
MTNSFHPLTNSRRHKLFCLEGVLYLKKKEIYALFEFSAQQFKLEQKPRKIPLYRKERWEALKSDMIDLHSTSPVLLTISHIKMQDQEIQCHG